jgi:hypothetical protein
MRSRSAGKLAGRPLGIRVAGRSLRAANPAGPSLVSQPIETFCRPAGLAAGWLLAGVGCGPRSSARDKLDGARCWPRRLVLVALAATCSRNEPYRPEAASRWCAIVVGVAVAGAAAVAGVESAQLLLSRASRRPTKCDESRVCPA